VSAAAPSWRQTLRSLAYVKLDQANGGIIRDLTESGMAIQAVGRLQPGQELDLRFDLISPRVRVDARGRVAWADPGGQAGIEFLGVTPRVQRAVRDWLLIQMLAGAAVSGRDSMFSAAEMELTFSAPARAAIVVELPVAESPRVEWGCFLTARGFSIFVDAGFGVRGVGVCDQFHCGDGRGSGMAAGDGAAANGSTIFVAVYQVMFSDLLCGATPGRRLAGMAGRTGAGRGRSGSGEVVTGEPGPRFRSCRAGALTAPPQTPA
jgi:hypothetical protein